ncbi:hypothetical protein [Salipiger bermudensis]|uniref:hypothetical protein n=1 Tax=Salipiger bermudensis TaxID=344736 RepID=UPI001CD1EC8B|nr:hypothetical protein [Salipiger bermudensis]MCA0963276.1 hypothetical protein [Salipiger bermudensis]
MSRVLSLNARAQQDAAFADDLPVVLLEVSHPDLDAPVRLSSDNADLISQSAEAQIRGTRSSWRGANQENEFFLWVPMGLEMPGDEDDVPAQMRIVIDLFDATLPALLRSFETRAKANAAVVMASTPNLVEQAWLGLEVVTARFGSQIAVQMSREPIEDEGAPMHVVGKHRFPGLYR